VKLFIKNKEYSNAGHLLKSAILKCKVFQTYRTTSIRVEKLLSEIEKLIEDLKSLIYKDFSK
jgi:hypothetical protein